MRVHKRDGRTQVQVCKDIQKFFWPFMSHTIGLDRRGSKIGRSLIQDDLIKFLSC